MKELWEPMTQADIARRARVSPISVNYICKGVRPAGRKMAEDLEIVTGIAREAWMWPHRWFNPYVDGSSPLLPDAKTYGGIKKQKKVIKKR